MADVKAALKTLWNNQENCETFCLPSHADQIFEDGACPNHVLIGVSQEILDVIQCAADVVEFFGDPKDHLDVDRCLISWPIKLTGESNGP